MKFASNAIATKTVPLSLARPIVSFTFDDFPRSAATVGADVLERHGARGTYYASGSLCGRTEDGIGYYGPEDLVSLHDRGHEIGSHTFGHTRTSTMTRTAIEEDVEKNHAFLKGILPGLVLEDFAYPFGDASPVSKLVLQRHYSSCRGTGEGLNVNRADLGLLKAVAPGEHQSGRGKVVEAIADAVERKGWLIFYTHDVIETPTRWGCSPQLLDEAVGHAVHSGAAVLTIREALAVISRRGEG
ncbi:MAG: polysaccharide deacetylase family protein [Bauldia sp.]|nr:polysaccharide deacetylase family protein [Bauldia sp.]